MSHFVEWDSIEIRVNGDKLNAMAQSLLGGMEPIESVELHFRNGLLRVSGSIRKFIRVPFTVDIREIRASGTTVRLPLGNASAAGIPLPSILFGLLRNRVPPDLVSYEEPSTLVMSLDRFLPSFITADVQQVWIIDGGLAVTLGRGGANLPAPPIPGGTHDRHHDHTRDSERAVAGD